MDTGEVIISLGVAVKAIGWAFMPILLLPLIYIFLPNINILQSISKAIIRTIDSFSYATGEAVKWLLPILVLTVAFTVFALSIFGQSWTKLFESADYFHASVIMLGAAATLLAGQHVRVDVFHVRMSAKTRALIDFMGYYALLLPVCLIILWNSQGFVSFAWRIFEGSSDADGIRGDFLLKTLIPIFAVTMILQGLAIALRAAMCLSGQDRPERPPHTPQFFSEQELEH
ncbi:TRAP transporter small permease subunit [Hellea balneolensis]|uniref:TRAP transporter small permease subunit n=1 Tax=Hellea balneolensis TaxID=287478 RepID=UPI0004020B53|nr:TRAP transporter small permease subunit [Hellea balneolensis]